MSGREEVPETAEKRKTKAKGGKTTLKKTCRKKQGARHALRSHRQNKTGADRHPESGEGHLGKKKKGDLEDAK